jgi:hypothetical protein
MTCPVCGFDKLAYPPRDYHICPCCGTEFGNDDARFSHKQLREMWVAHGAQWFFGKPAEHWNPWRQLIEGGHADAVPWGSAVVMTRANAVIGPNVTVQDQDVPFILSAA